MLQCTSPLSLLILLSSFAPVDAMLTWILESAHCARWPSSFRMQAEATFNSSWACSSFLLCANLQQIAWTALHCMLKEIMHDDWHTVLMARSMTSRTSSITTTALYRRGRMHQCKSVVWQALHGKQLKISSCFLLYKYIPAVTVAFASYSHICLACLRSS